MWTQAKNLLFALSYIISTLVVGAFWLNYKSYNSPRLELDTNYLWWTTTLPAISVCQVGGFNSSKRNITKDEFGCIRNLVRPRKSIRKACNLSRADVLREDYRNLTSDVVASCADLFGTCVWNGKQFDCCQQFGQLWTEKGVCYSANSDMIQDIHTRFSVSYFAKDAVMDLSLNYPIQVYIHDPKDVTFMKRKAPVIGFGSSLNVSFSTREILVDQSAWDLTVDQRGCILPGERVLLNFPKYSESACKAECLTKNQIEVCGCYHHLLPKTGDAKICDVKGLLCLDSTFSGMKQVNQKGLYKAIMKCTCPPACDETEVKIVWGKKSRNTNKSSIQVHLQLTAPPMERLILKARVDFLDSLVGFACFTRLFSGSSILGAVRSSLDWMFPYRPVPSYRQLLY